MPAIFISYRHHDSAGHTGRLSDKLHDCFGPNEVFQDYEAITKGKDFEQAIEDAMGSAAVTLLMIGPRWIEAPESGEPGRLYDPRDYVRREIEMALHWRLPILPVLVDGARMPGIEQMPKSLAALTKHQAQELRNDRWGDDVNELIRQIEEVADIEAVCEPNGTTIFQRAARALITFFPAFFCLFSQPVRFLARKNLGRPADLVSALVYFMFSILLADIFIFGTWQPAGESFIGIVLIGIPVMTIVTLLLSVPLWAAWWLVGARGHYRKILINVLYQTGMMVLFFCVSGAMIVIGIMFNNPDSFSQMIEIFKVMPLGQKTESMQQIFSDAFHGPVSFVTSGLALMLCVAALVWLLASWGAYRRVLRKNRIHSLIAVCLFIVLLVLPLVTFAWLGMRGV